MAEKLSERLEIGASIHEQIGGQSALSATIREAAELARRVEWRPIESASEAVHSGRPILLFSARWGGSVMLGGWDAHEEAWRVYGYGCPAAQPTHWMPLPEPPEVG